MLIDSHVHLSFFDPDHLAELLVRAKTYKISNWIMAGYDSADWQRQQAMVQQIPNIKTSFGLHPWRVIEMSPHDITQELQILEQMLPQANALGETGIDAFKTKDTELLSRQEAIFRQHLELNRPYDLPLVLHLVQAHERSYNILKQYSYRGIIHGFSGSWEMAQRYIQLGYKISLGRGLLQKGYKQLKETAQKIPLSDFVIESDAALDDQGRPEDALEILTQVAKALAELKTLPVETIGRANQDNVKAIFG